MFTMKHLVIIIAVPLLVTLCMNCFNGKLVVALNFGLISILILLGEKNSL